MTNKGIIININELIKELKEKGEESFEISVKLAPNDEFYFWLFKMGGKASILSPESVLDEYKKLFNK